MALYAHAKTRIFKYTKQQLYALLCPSDRAFENRTLSRKVAPRTVVVTKDWRKSHKVRS
jgi:hypothetical protein